MYDLIKTWARKHKKGIIITCSIVAVAGPVAILIVNGKKVTIPVQKLTDKIIPEVPTNAKPIETAVETIKEVTPRISQTEETGVGEVAGVLKIFPRTGGIRQLHAGQHASAKKLAQATAMGIDLGPGETIVNACMVRKRAA